MQRLSAKEYWILKDWKSLSGKKQRRAGRQPADGAPRTTAPTAFAKEHWILKD